MKRKWYLYYILSVLILAYVVVTGAFMETPEARTVVVVGGGIPAVAPAAIALNLAITNSQSGGATDTTILKPTGTVDGDFLLAAICWGSGTMTVVPDGWTQLATYVFNGTDNNLRIWYKRASSEGESWTWSTGTGQYTDGIVWRMTGVVASGSPLDVAVSTDTNAGTTVTSTGITTETGGSAIIQIGGTSNDYTTLSSTTLTERYDDGVTIFAAGDVQTNAESSGNKTGTLGSERVWGTILLALKPAT